MSEPLSDEEVEAWRTRLKDGTARDPIRLSRLIATIDSLKAKTETRSEPGQYVTIDPESEEVCEKWWVYDVTQTGKAVDRLNEWITALGQRDLDPSCIEAAIKYADALKADLDEALRLLAIEEPGFEDRIAAGELLRKYGRLGEE